MHATDLAEIDQQDAIAKYKPFHPACICLDVESSPREGDRIFKLAAFRPDTGQKVVLGGSAIAPANVSSRLDALCDGAAFVLGHNIRRHDLAAISEQFPGLRLLALPVVDTLELAPIAFPFNPYHKLVKDYKLVSDSRNDPLQDAELSFELFKDEIHALEEFQKTCPDLLALLHFLWRDDPSLSTFLAIVRQS